MLSISTTLCAAEIPIQSLTPLIDNGGYALQVDGQIVRSQELNTRLIPASTIKVLTSLMALDILGPEYRFATRLFLTEDNSLYIKGDGDPFLTSESVAAIAQLLTKQKIHALDRLVLDDTAFQLEGPPPGSGNTDNPYDAHSGALAVNFNALPFRVTGSRLVFSGEPQTPLLPLMREFASQYGKGNYRVNVSAFDTSAGHSNIHRYVGELFLATFKKEGIDIANGYTVGKTPAHATSLLLYESDKDVAELVRQCLHFSNNFIANQLYLSCGKRIFGAPATWAKAKRVAQKYIELRLDMDANSIYMEDGSGLSLHNKISPMAMLSVLNKFTPHADLLKERNEVLVKSGTLTGVYGYVGYFGVEQKRSPFVLLLNQTRNNRKLLLHLMKKEYNTITKPQ